MSGHPYDDAPQPFEDEPVRPKYLDIEFMPTTKTGKKLSKAKKNGKRTKPEDKKPPEVPKVPERELLTGDEIRQGISNRNRSAANLKIEGFSYQEIAEMLEFPSAAAAKRAVESVLAAIHGPDELETVRMTVIARAERLFKQSMTMATADSLRLSDGTEVPNADRLRWHQQAAVDMMNHAAITGAKAPVKVEMTPGEADLEKIANMIARRSGHEDIVDAEVIDLPEIEAATSDEDD